jgi:hypothetical protein
VVRADGTPVLNPPPHTVLAAGDRLVVVAPDDAAVRWDDGGRHVDPSAISGGGFADEPSRLLLLGWNRRAPHLVDQLRRAGRPGSVLHVVTDPCEQAPPLTLPEPRRPPEHADGLVVTFGAADPTDPASLRALDPASYDRVIVLGPAHGEHADRPDDHTLVVLLLLRSLAQEAGREVPVVAELADERNRALAPLGPDSEAVVGGRLTGLLMAQVAQNGHLAAVFEELFAAGGSALRLRPARRYVAAERPASFATVVAAARERGECAIGYRCRDPTAPAAHRVRLNPAKTDARVWSDADGIVVIVTDGPTAGAAEGGGPPTCHGERVDVP